LDYVAGAAEMGMPSFAEREDLHFLPNGRSDPRNLFWAAKKVEVGDFQGFVGKYKRVWRRVEEVVVPDTDQGALHARQGRDGEILWERSAPSAGDGKSAQSTVVISKEDYYLKR
jgi:outer membrane protein assembly factor BamB